MTFVPPRSSVCATVSIEPARLKAMMLAIAGSTSARLNSSKARVTRTEVNQEKELNRAALRQQDVVTQLGTSPDRAEDLLTRINNAASAEELNQIIYSQQ